MWVKATASRFNFAESGGIQKVVKIVILRASLHLTFEQESAGTCSCRGYLSKTSTATFALQKTDEGE